jgi:hypothetical protein
MDHNHEAVVTSVLLKTRKTNNNNKKNTQMVEIAGEKKNHLNQPLAPMITLSNSNIVFVYEYH